MQCLLRGIECNLTPPHTLPGLPGFLAPCINGAVILKFCSSRWSLAPLYHSCSGFCAPRQVYYFSWSWTDTWPEMTKDHYGGEGMAEWVHHIQQEVEPAYKTTLSNPFPLARLHSLKVLEPSQILPPAVNTWAYGEHFTFHLISRYWANTFLGRFPAGNSQLSLLSDKLEVLQAGTRHGWGLALKVLSYCPRAKWEASLQCVNLLQLPSLHLTYLQL